MRDGKVTQRVGGLLIKQWYVDTFYDDVDKLPYPQSNEFDKAVDKINEETEAIVLKAFAKMRSELDKIGVRLEEVER